MRFAMFKKQRFLYLDENFDETLLEVPKITKTP